ncbi:MAG: RsiV family protein [Bacteroidia bacterium]
MRDLVYKRVFESAKERFEELTSPEELFLYLEFKTKWENFRNFYLSTEVITFIYQPYQVSAWIYGEHHAAIKFSEIPLAAFNQTKIPEILALMREK